MSEKLIALSGAETEVHFSGGNAWLRNDGASAVYAAKTAGVTAGADGVVSIPAGGSAPVYGANGTVFLLGSGSVQLVGSDYATNPFKTSAQAGGSGADEVARAAIEAHAGNAEIHVTAEEKAAWNGKFDYIGVVRDLFAVNKTCVCAYDMNTLNTPFSSGLTLSGAGLCFVNYVAGAEYATYLVISSGDTNHYAAASNNGSEHVKWHKISDGGNADTLDNLHSSSFMQWIGEQNDTTIIGDANYKNNYLCNVATGKSLLGLPIEGWYHIEYHQHINDNGYGMQIAYPLNFTGSIMVRYAVGTTWGKWSNIADGGNADTLDGLHADDFVKTSHESYQIPIPNDVDVPIWIADNAKLYTRYYSCYENTGLTNVAGGDPNDSVWYYFDGINIIATCNMTKKVWIACVANGGFIGWVQINTTSLPANGGNADTLESHPATDFVLKSDYDALAARVAALEEAIIVSNGETTE